MADRSDIAVKPYPINAMETLFIGCKPSDEVVEIHKSHVIRFCAETMNAHATVMHHIHSAYCKAQLLADEKISDKPFRISVLWPVWPDAKRKWEDKESAYEKMIWWFHNLKAPTNGLVVTFYNTKNVAKKRMPTFWSTNHLWPTEKQWEPKGKYVTLQDIEHLIGNKLTKQYYLDNDKKYRDIIKKYAKDKNLEIKNVNYSMTNDEVYDLLLGSNYHFSYYGATYWFAASLNTPTICYMSTAKFHPQRRLHWDDRKNEYIEEEYTFPSWGEMKINSVDITQFDLNLNRIYTGPVRYMKGVNSPKEFKKILCSL